MTATSMVEHDLDALPEDLGIYVYGVVGPASEVDTTDLAGLDEAPVVLVESGDVAAAVAVIALDRPPGRKRELLAHSRVLDALAERGPVVPAQFGTVLLSAADVRAELLEAREAELTEAIGDLQESGAGKKVSGAVKGAKKALTGGGDDEDEEEPRRRPAKRPARSRSRE